MKAKNQNPETPITGHLVNAYSVLEPGGGGRNMDIISENLGDGGVGSLDLPRIKVATGGGTTWVVDGVDEPVTELEGILLAWRMERLFWKGAYGGSRKRPPDCISRDGFSGVGDPGGPCRMCPNAQFDSAPQGRGQACKQVRQLLVLRPDEALPRLLSVPPTSLKNAAQYFVLLASKNIAHWAVVTRMRLERTENEGGIAYSKILFAPGRTLSEEERKRLRPFQQQCKQILHSDAIDVSHLIDEGGEEVVEIPALPPRASGPEDPEVPF
jgi:hypothetical protein